MFPIRRRLRDGSCFYRFRRTQPSVPLRDGSGRGVRANRGRGCGGNRRYGTGR